MNLLNKILCFMWVCVIKTYVTKSVFQYTFLEPCDALQSDCKAVYKHPGDNEYDFYIKDDKYARDND